MKSKNEEKPSVKQSGEVPSEGGQRFHFANWKRSVCWMCGSIVGLVSFLGGSIAIYTFISGGVARTLSRKIFKQCEPSLVVVSAPGQKNIGFVAESDGNKYVYTVRHAVMDKDHLGKINNRLRVTTLDERHEIDIDACEYCMDTNQHSWIGVEWVDAVRFKTKTELPALRFSEREINIGDHILVVGCVDGESEHIEVVEGTVRSTSNQLYIRHDAKTPVGFSGGPILDSSGYVVGMDSFDKSSNENDNSVGSCYGVRLPNRSWKPASEAQKGTDVAMKGRFMYDYNGKGVLWYTDSRNRTYRYKSFICPVTEEEKKSFSKTYVLCQYKPSNVYTVARRSDASAGSDFHELNVSEINANTFIEPETVAILADMLFYGQGVDPDRRQAAHLYEVAAEKGNVLAQFNTGICYANGLGVGKDDAEAFKWLSMAAENNNARAQFCLASFYFSGQVCERNESEELRWLEASAANGFVEAEKALGNYLWRKGEVSAAAVWFKKAAEQGDADSLARLGKCHELGMGADRDEQLALDMYRKAESMGSVIGELMIGHHYHRLGDREKAIRYYESARSRGDAEASLRLGQLYEYDGCGERDLVRADELYRESADRGCVDAITKIGDRFLQVGEFEKAIMCFIEASALGDPEAQCYLGDCYEMGWGVCPNINIAINHYREAARRGSGWAQVALGECFVDGVGCETNLTEAVALFRKATERGFAAAQYDLGCCYAEGLGVESNATVAVEWYIKAANQDYPPAIHALGECYADGFGVEKNMSKAVECFRRAELRGYEPSAEALEHYAAARNESNESSDSDSH